MIVYSLLVFLALLGVLLFFVKPLKLFKIHIVGREPYLIARGWHRRLKEPEVPTRMDT